MWGEKMPDYRVELVWYAMVRNADNEGQAKRTALASLHNTVSKNPDGLMWKVIEDPLRARAKNILESWLKETLIQALLDDMTTQDVKDFIHRNQ